MSSKELEKTEKGTFDYQCDDQNEIIIVKLYGIKYIALGVNYDTIEPLAAVNK